MTDVLTWPDDHRRAKILARTRSAIVVAAGSLFLDQGFERTSMERVASDARIGLMTLYRHFRTKSALFRVVMESECSIAELIPNREAIWSQPPEEALRMFGEAIIAVLVSPRQLALRRLVIAEAERFPELGQAWHESGPARGIAEVAGYVTARARAGDFPSTDPDAFARMYIGLLDRLPLQRLMALTLAEPEEIRAEAVQVAKTMLGSGTLVSEPTSNEGKEAS